MTALLLLLELWNVKSSILSHYIFDFVTPWCAQTTGSELLRKQVKISYQYQLRKIHILLTK